MRIPEFKRKGVMGDLPDYRTPYRTSVAAGAAVAAATGAGGSAGFVVPTGGQTIGHQESMDLEEYGRCASPLRSAQSPPHRDHARVSHTPAQNTRSG